MASRARASAMIPAAAIACGCLALATRPLAWRSSITLVLVGAIGLLGVIPVQARPVRVAWVPAVALGMGAFAVVRLLEVPIGRPFALAAVGVHVLAGVSEEAFFRRYAYAWLTRWGAPVAIGVGAVLFALVHVPQYGLAVLPLDLAAGGLFGWQRWATGSWTAPAVTHVVANLLQMG